MTKTTKKVPAPRLRFPGFTGEWEEKTGGQLFNQISNKKHNSDLPILAITQDKGAVPRSEIDYHVSVTNESVDSYKVVEVDDFIISLRSFQGGIEYSKYKGICSPAYVILRANKEASTSYFQHYFKYDGFIKDLTKNLEGLRDGKMISYKQFSEVPIPLPSLSEQTRIAAALSSLDAVIAAHQSRQDALREHKRGLMAGLFPAEGERVPRLRFPEFEGAGEWEEKKLGEAIKHIGSGKSKSDASGLYSLYGSTGIIGRTNDNNHSGTFINVARVGANAGYTQLVSGEFGATDNTLVISLRSEYNYGFIFAYLNYLDLNKLVFGSGQPLITGKSLKDLSVTLPSLPEQTRIAAALSSLDDLIAAQGDHIAALQAFKRGLMQGLFPASSADLHATPETSE